MAGVQRVQHVPAGVPKGKSGMRQTSYATVMILGDEQAAPALTLRRGDPGVHVAAARGTGPGGQNRNTRDRRPRLA